MLGPRFGVRALLRFGAGRSLILRPRELLGLKTLLRERFPAGLLKGPEVWRSGDGTRGTLGVSTSLSSFEHIVEARLRLGGEVSDSSECSELSLASDRTGFRSEDGRDLFIEEDRSGSGIYGTEKVF